MGLTGYPGAVTQPPRDVRVVSVCAIVIVVAAHIQCPSCVVRMHPRSRDSAIGDEGERPPHRRHRHTPANTPIRKTSESAPTSIRQTPAPISTHPRQRSGSRHCQPDKTTRLDQNSRAARKDVRHHSIPARPLAHDDDLRTHQHSGVWQSKSNTKSASADSTQARIRASVPIVEKKRDNKVKRISRTKGP